MQKLGMQRPVKIEYGVPKVSQRIAEFMAACKSKESTRYAIGNVGITGGQMAVTDGRRLLVVTPTDTFDPPIEDGIYYLTGEGFLLKINDERKFPKWQDLTPEDAEDLGAFVLNDGNRTGIAKALATIFGPKALFNTKWIFDAFARLQGCGCDFVKIKKAGDDKPILIIADSIGVSFQYIQMPFSS